MTTNYWEGFRRICVVLSALCALSGLGWSYRAVVEHRRFVVKFEQRVQALRFSLPPGLAWDALPANQSPPGDWEFELPTQRVDVPEIGMVEFPKGMTATQIREAIFRLASGNLHITRPTWYWYGSLVMVPLIASLIPLVLYRVSRWVARGFVK